MLMVAAVAGLTAFCWPLLIDPAAVLAGNGRTTTFTPIAMGLIVALVLVLVLTQVTNGDLDAKALAMLGVLCAVGAIVRPLGTGTAGMETIFFLLILAGAMFGPGFGFALGALTLFASALITGGVGPWLPYQMLGAAYVGCGAGLLPRRSQAAGRPGNNASSTAVSTPGRGSSARRMLTPNLPVLILYGVVAAFAYGYLTDLAMWPFFYGSTATQLGFDPAAGPLRNLRTFLVTNTVTSFGWNLGRAVTTGVLLGLLGRPLSRLFARAARRAQWTAPAPADPPTDRSASAPGPRSF